MEPLFIKQCVTFCFVLRTRHSLNNQRWNSMEQIASLKAKHETCVPVTTPWRVLRLRMQELPPIWRLAANILTKHQQTADIGWSSTWGLGEVLTTPPFKTYLVSNYSQTKPQSWTDTLVRPKQRKKDKRFGAWNVRSLYRAGSVTAAAGNWLDVN